MLTVGGGMICIIPSEVIAMEAWSREETGAWSRVVAEKSVPKKKKKSLSLKQQLYTMKRSKVGGGYRGDSWEGKTVRKKVTTKWWYFTKASPWQQFYDLNRSYFFETPTEGEFTGEGREGGWVREKEERTASRSTPSPVFQTPHINSLDPPPQDPIGRWPVLEHGVGLHTTDKPGLMENWGVVTNLWIHHPQIPLVGALSLNTAWDYTPLISLV